MPSTLSRRKAAGIEAVRLGGKPGLQPRPERIDHLHHADAVMNRVDKVPRWARRLHGHGRGRPTPRAKGLDAVVRPREAGFPDAFARGSHGTGLKKRRVQINADVMFVHGLSSSSARRMWGHDMLAGLAERQPFHLIDRDFALEI